MRAPERRGVWSGLRYASLMRAAMVLCLAILGCASPRPSGLTNATRPPGDDTEQGVPLPPAVGMGYTCTLPFTLPGTATEVAHRSTSFTPTGTEFGFDSGPAAWPAVTVEHAFPPFTDVDGQEIVPQGTRYLRITLSGVAGGVDTSSWVNNDDTFIRSVHGIGAPDDRSPWLVGVRDDACVRVIPLAAPARLLVEFVARDGA